MRVALLQMTSSDDPTENLSEMTRAVAEAARQNADILLTPEVCNCLSNSRSWQNEVLRPEAHDQTLLGLRGAASDAGIMVLAGSLALKSDPPETRFANRSILIGPDGGVLARYDKIHMFDVNVSEEETYRESEGFAPGHEAVVVRAPKATFGLSVCYDLRFAYLFRALAHAGAQILTVPAAFSPGTGPMHWEPLLRARAIETGCFVVAPAQTGRHTAKKGRSRRTWGHSLVVSPWGEVLLDAGEEPGLHVVDLDLSAVDEARLKVPALRHDQTFTGP